MMPDATSPSPGTWAVIVGALATAAASLIGVLNSLRQAPFTNRLITAQAEVAEGQKDRAQLDGITAAGEYVLQTLKDSRETIDRLRAERDAALEEIRVLREEQKERHRLANRTHIAETRWALMLGGMSLEELQRVPIKPIYEIEDEPGEG